jgi:thiamine kinase-like enzyme
VDPGRGRFPLRLCHVDPNLANAIWGPDGRLRWVDWEYSGWGDPALDLAELRWHAALAGLDEAQHTWLRDTYRRPDDDPGFDERIAVWDRLLATRWPFLALRWLWSEHNGPDRVRLTRMRVDPAEMRARLVRFIERAERLEST